MNRPPADPERIVKPRKATADWRPVIAVSRDLVVIENRNDDVFHVSELGSILAAEPSSILVVQGFGQHLRHLQQEFQGDPEFNYRVTPLRRYARSWNDGRKLEAGMILDAVCNWVGWRHEIGRTRSGKPKFKTHYHFPLDPLWFLSTDIDTIKDSDWPTRIGALYEWGKEVRDWCHKNNLKVTSSAGGVAAQLLRDSRFYPEPRRKVPAGVNRIARYQLPGNYYRLHPRTKLRTPYSAVYLDMENAHHAMARRIRFPDANTLRAYGDWSLPIRQDENPSVPPRPFSHRGNPILDRPGMFHVTVNVPHIPIDHFPPPFLERSGVQHVVVYSNELELIQEHGAEIRSVNAAYVSAGTEPGLNKYAEFAIGEIRAHPDYKPWLKPTLHATYGLLAARPNRFETGYFRARGGDRIMYPMGNASIEASAKLIDRELESRIVNVIHRGMIEAEVRKRVLWFARYLVEVERQRVLAIYADSVFVEDTGRQIGLLEPPWRVSQYVSSLRFLSSVHFVSPSINRLPGVPRSARERFVRDRALAQELRQKSAKSGIPA